jgi:hypothetical protein
VNNFWLVSSGVEKITIIKRESISYGASLHYCFNRLVLVRFSRSARFRHGLTAVAGPCAQWRVVGFLAIAVLDHAVVTGRLLAPRIIWICRVCSVGVASALQTLAALMNRGEVKTKQKQKLQISFFAQFVF